MEHLRLRCVDHRSERLISLPRAVAKPERLTGGQAVRVKLGLLTSRATLTVRRAGKEDERPLDLQISRDLLNELNLTPGLRCNLRIDRGAGTVVLGPVVGVFVNPRYLASIELGDVPKSASYHARAAWDAHVFLYYFSHEQIDWLTRTATAWVYEGGGSWSRRTAPLPDVVYDRGVNFRDEEQPLVKYVRAQFQSSPLVQRINARDALDKWWLFQRLKRYEQLKPHLPETIRYHGLSEVQDLLGRHGRVFLKSFYGRGGTEVLAIEQDGRGGYLCYASNLRQHCGSLRDVLAVIHRFFQTDKIVVQQGIPLLRYQGRKLDLRVQLNKDGRGTWQVTCNQVRVASGESRITNIHCHGEPFAFWDLMPTVLGAVDRTALKEREVADFCTDVVRCIEREYGPFGEIGLDVALDDQGGIWLLEANAKPAKNPEPYEAGPPYPQFTRLVEYAKHLAGFSPSDWQITEEEVSMDTDVALGPVQGLATCRISSELGADLGGEDGREYVLRAGTAALPVILALDPGLKPHSLTLEAESSTCLSLPDKVKTNLVVTGGEIRLGPVVGVLVNRRTVAAMSRGQAGFRSAKLMNANRRAKCILYFFSVSQVMSTEQIAGYYFDHPRKRWCQALFPWPDVLYDRGGGFHGKDKATVRRIRRQMSNTPGLRLFNAQHYFDKWDLYRRLRRNALMVPHLPETALYLGQEDLAGMLRQHGRIYVKSLRGSNGREVMQVGAEAGHFTYRYFKGKLMWGTCTNLAALGAVIEGFLGRKRLILQRAVDVLQVNGAHIDLRALVIKDSEGAWRLISLPVRVGLRGCPVTSTRSGSTVHRFDELGDWYAMSKDQLAELRNEVERVVWLTTQTIEQEYGSFGELGIDVAVDNGGKVWVLEANSKPAKTTVRLSGDKETLARAFLTPLQYCLHLAGFAGEERKARMVRIRSATASV